MTDGRRSSSSKNRSGSKYKKKDGTATQVNSRVAMSGNHAHSCLIGGDRFTLFSEDAFCPFSDGDMVSFEYEVKTLRSGSRRPYNSIVAESLRLTVPADMSERVSGHVYILSNKSMTGLLKIGFTNGDPTKRAAELSGVSGVPTAFRVEWSMPIIGNARAIEQRIHAVLDNARHGKEFFRTSLEEAQSVARRCYVELYPDTASELEGALSAADLAAVEKRKQIAEEYQRRETMRREQEEREAFERSPAQLWKRHGSYEVQLRSFSEKPRPGSPGFFSKLLGHHYPDWIEVRIAGDVRKDDLPWKLSLNGLVKGKWVSRTAHFQRVEDALETAKRDADALCPRNQKWLVYFTNELVVEPLPHPPHGNSTTLKLSIWPQLQLLPEFGCLPSST